MEAFCPISEIYTKTGLCTDNSGDKMRFSKKTSASGSDVDASGSDVAALAFDVDVSGSDVDVSGSDVDVSGSDADILIFNADVAYRSELTIFSFLILRNANLVYPS